MAKMRATINPEERNGNQCMSHSGGPNGLTHTPPAQEPKNIVKNIQKKPVREASRPHISISNGLKIRATIEANNNSNTIMAFPDKIFESNQNRLIHSTP